MADPAEPATEEEPTLTRKIWSGVAVAVIAISVGVFVEWRSGPPPPPPLPPEVRELLYPTAGASQPAATPEPHVEPRFPRPGERPPATSATPAP